MGKKQHVLTCCAPTVPSVDMLGAGNLDIHEAPLRHLRIERVMKAANKYVISKINVKCAGAKL